MTQPEGTTQAENDPQLLEADCGGPDNPCTEETDDLPEAEPTDEDAEATLPGPETPTEQGKDNTLEAIFPAFALKLQLGPLELRLLRDRDFPAYAALLREDIFAPDFADAMFPWAAGSAEDRIRSAVQYQWTRRATLDPGAWALPFAVFYNGELVGSQEINSIDFGVSRTVRTGSWLTRRMHGRGLGTLMRQAVLMFAFDHLKAERAESAALITNTPSIATSRKVGYAENGLETVVENGKACQHQRMLLEASNLVRPEAELHVEGLTPALITELGAG